MFVADKASHFKFGTQIDHKEYYPTLAKRVNSGSHDIDLIKFSEMGANIS